MGFGDADRMFNRADLLLGDFLHDAAMQLMPPLVADFLAAEGRRIQAAVQIEISILPSLIRMSTCGAYVFPLHVWRSVRCCGHAYFRASMSQSEMIGFVNSHTLR